MAREKIVLAFSGGLDTSVAIRWLQETYNYDVIAMAADVGEGKDLQAIYDKAMAIGALDCQIIDLKETFAHHFLDKALKANTLYEGVYPLISALSRPLISKKLIEVAHQYDAVAVAHGCTGKGNDQVRFDVSLKTLDPNIKIVAPVRENPMSREEAIAYAQAHNIPVSIKKDNPFSIDMNLWGRSCECGVLEDPWCEPPEQAYALTAAPELWPDAPEYLEIRFEKGLPVALNQQDMPFHELIAALNEIAGKHGIGRIDHVENRLVGIKSREVYEAPAAMTLIRAHQALETLCLTRDTAAFKLGIEQKLAQIIYDGQWYSPLFKALNAFVDETQQLVSGVVRMKLFKGNAIVSGRQSAHSLYSYELATYKKDDQFDHQAAEGFIKIFGLPMQVNAQVNKEYQS